MPKSRRLSTGNVLYALWSLVVCPVLGLLAVFPTHGEGGATRFVLLFCVLPAVLAAIGGVVTHRDPALTIGLSIAAGLLGAAVWLLVIIAAAASGVYDT